MISRSAGSTLAVGGCTQDAEAMTPQCACLTRSEVW